MTSHYIRSFVWSGLLIAVGVALLLSPFASQSPDGLERVAEDKGFLEKGEASVGYQAPAPDYAVPGVRSEWMSTSLAGVLGTILTFGAAYGLGRLVGRRRRQLVQGQS
jgi:cobalt/nickel transport protein